MDEEPVPHVLPHPVRCEDCENSNRAFRACRLDPLHEWPGVKELGCLYWRERGREMTGIERLYKLIADIDVRADPELWYILRGGTEGGWDCEEHDGKTLDSTLAAIANQIKREQGGRVYRMRVLSVVTEMERHCLGHEGMDDSPVARWARELLEALGGNGRDPAADVSVSAYDLLPQEDREAISWVREHGGLDHVKEEWGRRSNLKRQLEKERAKVERQQRHIEFVQGKCRELEAWNRRAERTCRMEYNERGSHDEYYPTECYNCSECGHMTYDGVPTFCPNCGARVIEEGV